MGDSVGGWFKEKLGIHSPSRVFMGFGDNIAQGAAIGLQRTTPLAALAGQRLAAEMTPDVPVSRRRKSWLRDIQAAQLQLVAERLAVSRSALILSFSSMAKKPQRLTG